jgi:4-amino-4-deoxy-L-arabinose transferase-like glycosyltransferase
VRDAGGRSRFFAILGLILLVALGVRLGFIFGESKDDKSSFYDAAYYELQARAVADGRGYNDPFQFLPNHPHKSIPAAEHPPLTVFALVPVAWVGDRLDLSTDTSQLLMRFEIMVVGLAGVVLLALLGREIAGETVGLVAAGIAAVYPYLWVNDGLIMSESFAATAVIGALLITFRLIRAPSWPRALALGAVCGLAALARAELLLLAPLLGIPLLWTFRDRPWSERLRPVVVLAAGAVLIVGPWIAFNLSRFQDPTLLSTNDGLAMVASNCDAAYFGPATGLTILRDCIPPKPKGDPSVVSKKWRDDAIDYMSKHKKRAGVVILARIGRNYSLFRPADMLSWNEAEGRPRWVTALGLWFYYPLLAFAIGGVVVMKRRHVRQWPILVPPIIVVASTLVSYGQTRFRVPAEPSIVLLAAVAIGALATRIRQSRTSAASSSS